MLLKNDKNVFDYKCHDSLPDFIEKARKDAFYGRFEKRDVEVSDNLAKLFGDGNPHGVLESRTKGADNERKQEFVILLDNGRELHGLHFGMDFKFAGESVIVKSKDFDINQLLIASKMNNFPRPVDVVNNELDYVIVNRVSARYCELVLLSNHDGDVELLGKSGNNLLVKFVAETPSLGRKEIFTYASHELLDVSQEILDKVQHFPGDMISEANSIKFYLDDLLDLKDFSRGLEFMMKHTPEDRYDEYHAIVAHSHDGINVMNDELMFSDADSEDAMYFSDAISDECLRKINPNAKLMSVSEILQIQPDLDSRAVMR